MRSRNRERGARMLAAAAACLLLAGQAWASEGNIVIFPTENPPMLVALLVLFVALIFPVNSLVFRPIFKALDARAEKIAGTRARAEKLSAEADEVLARYQGSIRAVREESEQTRRTQLAGAKDEATGKLGAARSDAEREIESARTAIAGELARARDALRSEAEVLAREAAARILGRSVS